MYKFKKKTMFFPHIIGIVPIFCEEIFVGINEKKQGGDTAQYEVLKIIIILYTLFSLVFMSA